MSGTSVDPFGPRGGGFYPGWSPSWHLRGPWGWHYYDPWMGGPILPRPLQHRHGQSYRAMADVALSRMPCATAPGTFNAAQIVQNLRPQIVPPRVR
jgi:hypothetical protein